MVKYQMALLLLLSLPLELSAQRYGRPDAAQNYGLVQNRQLLLQIKVHKKRSYFRTLDLRKMKRAQLTLSDPSTGLSHTYEGVYLDDLLPPGSMSSESTVIEVSFDTHQTSSIKRSQLDPEVRPMVADTVDGKKLIDYVPYYFLARIGNRVVVGKNTELIAIK